MNRQTAFQLLPIVALAATLRFWGLTFGLPNTEARPDEGRIVRTAVTFVLDGTLNPRFFGYPTLFMYSMASVYAAGCSAGIAVRSFPDMRACIEADWLKLIVVARALSALAGVAGVAAVFAIARRLSPSAALPASALLAVAFLHVRDSHFGVTDVAMTSMLLAALLLLLRADREPSARRFALAGLVTGLAASTKYNAILLVSAAAVSQIRVWTDVQAPVPVKHTRFAWFAACAILGFLAGTPYALVSRREFIDALRHESWHLGYGHGIGETIGWKHHALVTLPHGVGWPLLLLGVAGIVWMLVRRPHVATIVFAFPLVYYVVAGQGYTVFARYMLPVIPFLCIGAAAMIATIADGLGRRREAVRAVVTAVLLLFCALPTGVKAVQLDRLLSRTDSRVLAMEWVRDNVRPRSTILMTGGGFQFWDHGELLPYEAALWESESHRLNDRKTRPDWIAVEESPLRQYSVFPPQLAPILDEYVLRHTIQALRVSEPHVYDQQDAFYLPIDGFARIARPGPNIRFYERRPVDAGSTPPAVR
jgi:hypothetical protein